ncbi:MAG: exodeoxyribonuclease VII large subunit [Dehalococcoidia bacterium]
MHQPDDGTAGTYAATDAVFTVGQVAVYLKEYLDANPLLGSLTVIGEVSNYRLPGSGHHYFTLRDADSALRCVMFRSGRGGEFLADGALVLAHGRVSLYPQRGDLQLYVDRVQPEGLGALQQAFEELKRKLAAEGLFDLARKRVCPEYPQRIAVITSPTGSVLQDILNVLRRRYPLAEVVVVPTPVQGDTAAPGIAGAFSAINEAADIDVAILARGGGSLEDLWPFNEEMVARAIFASKVPVISAVGHETDITIADLVADVRAPTPSAAAEIVAPDRLDLAQRVHGGVQDMEMALERMIRDARFGLEQAVDRLSSRAPETRAPRDRVEDMLARARLAAARLLESKSASVRTLEASLRALGPHQILDRGYAIVRKKDGPVLTSITDVTPGDMISVTLVDGSVDAETV